MADIINIKKHKDFNGSFYSFSMSNKPELTFMCDILDIKILQDGSTWYVHTPNKYKAHHYIRTAERPFHRHFHRLIVTEDRYSNESVTDHKDRDTLNCRRYNLRIVDTVTNSKNSERQGRLVNQDNKSYRGVAIVKVSRPNRAIKFQSYFKKKYIGAASTVSDMELKIDKFLELNLCQI